MLSYQHAYHAGNFADVHKHLTLHAVIDHLLRKASPITFFDTHAGRGLYPLEASETQRLGEYRHGVLPLWQAREALSDEPLLAGWLEAIAALQSMPAGSNATGLALVAEPAAAAGRPPAAVRAASR